ncbi:MAG: hypothetical protein ACTSRA_12935, partial [Promethearchaeota archaeon]
MINMPSFPIKEFRDLFFKYFEGSELEDLFLESCKIIEGDINPSEIIYKVRLRFYNSEDDDFDFNDWLINAGRILMIFKGYIISKSRVNLKELERYIDWFQTRLRDSIQDLHDDELCNVYYFLLTSECLKYYVEDGIGSSGLKELEDFLDNIFNELEMLPDSTKIEGYSLLVPALLDLMKLNPDKMFWLLNKIDYILEQISDDITWFDDTLGLCVRTLAFQDYYTPSLDMYFEWALNHVEKIKDSFNKNVALESIAVGYGL